jgi:hypothetical protein
MSQRRIEVARAEPSGNASRLFEPNQGQTGPQLAPISQVDFLFRTSSLTEGGRHKG